MNELNPTVILTTKMYCLSKLTFNLTDKRQREVLQAAINDHRRIAEGKK